MARCVLLLVALIACHAPEAREAREAREAPPATAGSPVSRAEALARASRWADAAAAWAEVTAGNPTHGSYWRALAEARRQIGDPRGAIAAYEHAIGLGDDPAEAVYAIAGCQLRQGDREAAIAALTRAFALGYRDLEHARRDDALAGLRDDARFADLVGLPARPFASRDDGWQFDLRLVSREVHRRGYDPFRRLSPAELDARLAALAASVPRLSDGELVVELAKWLREVGDGHTGVLGVRRPEFAWALPLSLFVFDDGVYVVAADPRWRALVGTRVERIDGHAVRDVLAALDPLLSRDNAMWPRAIAPYRMRSTALLHALGLTASAERATLAIRDGAATREVVVDADTAHPDIWNALPYPAGWVGPPVASWYARDNGIAYWFVRDAAHQLVYVQYNRIADAAGLAAFAARVVAALQPRDKLVIDLRHNNGGDTFANEPLLHALLRVDGLDRRGRMFVLIGRRTFSAALNAAAYFERHFHPVFVGEPTGGKPNSAGDEVPFSLPYSGVLVNVSDLYWESSWPEDRRTWIAPEIYAPPTVEAMRTGGDPAIAAVLAFSP